MSKTEKVIGAVCVCDCVECREWSFFELLLDSTLLKGTFYVAKDVIEQIGYLNPKLKKKQIYEWSLRIAEKYSVVCINSIVYEEWCSQQLITETEWIEIPIQEEWLQESSFQTECYVIGRYKKELLESNLFNVVVQKLLLLGNEELNHYLEKMLSNSKEFLELYDVTQPILIYCGSKECHGILDYFAREFGRALALQGERVEYFDLAEHSFQGIAKYRKRRWKAIIGVQTYMFSVQNEDDSFVHDEIDAPLFHFVFDHPVWMRNHLERVPKRMTIFTLDNYYVEFIKKYYGHKAVFFPPAGTEKEEKNAFEQRQFGISFVGEFGDGLAEALFSLRKIDKEKAKFANLFLKYLKKDISQPSEEAMIQAMKAYGVEGDEKQLIELLSEYRWMIYGMAKYYRKKVVEKLLKAGITLHVYGDTWKYCPLRIYKNLICHEMVQGDAMLEVYAQSQISLNIMSWHKGGFTERIANAMLQKSVVLTDKTTYLEEHFKDGEELVMFDLMELEQLPQRVKKLLNDMEKMKEIAEQGYQKAKAEHTWMIRAKTFLKIIEK